MSLDDPEMFKYDPLLVWLMNAESFYFFQFPRTNKKPDWKNSMRGFIDVRFFLLIRMIIDFAYLCWISPPTGSMEAGY